MKSIVWIIGFTFIMTSNLFSQQSDWELIPKVGVSFNSVYDPSVWDYKFSPLLIGLELSKPVSDRVRLSTEILYIRKGPHSKKENSIREQDYIFDFIILSPQINYALFENIKVETLIGPYVGFLFNSKVKFHPEEEFSKYSDNNKKVDLGMHLSIRKIFQISNFELLLEPRFQLGLIEVSNSKQISFQLLLGAKF